MDCALDRTVDSKLFLLGLEPVYRAANFGLEVAGRGAEGDCLCRLPEVAGALLVVIPGILAYNLFSGDLLNAATGQYDYDRAFPVLVRNLIKPMPLVSWFVLAALTGAVISSLASMLNSASTIATMDLYSKFSGEKTRSNW